MKKEFIIRILKILNKEDYEQVLKNARGMGLKVDGFRDTTKVPMFKLIAILNSNQNKTLEYINCIAKAIISQSEYALEKDKDNEQAKLRGKVARFALHNGNKNEESMEKVLEELEHNAEQGKNQEEVMVTDGHQKHSISSENYAIRISKLERLVADLTEAAEKAKEKNKKLEIKIMQLNMENETKEKLIKRQEKELNHAKVCQDREDAYIALNTTFDQLQREYNSLNERLKERDNQLAQLSEQLGHYEEENSKKVLCFTKKELPSDDFSGIRIHNVASFDMNNLIHWEDYDEIWIITKDFGYATIREIERLSKKAVHTFYSRKVITTV